MPQEEDFAHWEQTFEFDLAVWLESMRTDSGNTLADIDTDSVGTDSDSMDTDTDWADTDSVDRDTDWVGIGTDTLVDWAHRPANYIALGPAVAAANLAVATECIVSASQTQAAVRAGTSPVPQVSVFQARAELAKDSDRLAMCWSAMSWPTRSRFACAHHPVAAADRRSSVLSPRRAT